MRLESGQAGRGWAVLGVEFAGGASAEMKGRHEVWGFRDRVWCCINH